MEVDEVNFWSVFLIGCSATWKGFGSIIRTVLLFKIRYKIISSLHVNENNVYRAEINYTFFSKSSQCDGVLLMEELDVRRMKT
jgi:hypothetical protein